MCRNINIYTNSSIGISTSIRMYMGINGIISRNMNIIISIRGNTSTHSINITMSINIRKRISVHINISIGTSMSTIVDTSIQMNTNVNLKRRSRRNIIEL